MCSIWAVGETYFAFAFVFGGFLGGGISSG
jgi:hypothetical protein